MLARTRRRKGGFTLIELLVVMAIIAVLAALIAPAIQQVRVKRAQTENLHRMSKIAMALAGLKDSKNALGLAHVPSYAVNTTVAPGAPGAPVGFALKSVYTGNEPELHYLRKAWQNMNSADRPDPLTGDTSNGYTGPDVVLDANQVMTLFLTGGVATNFRGFSTNPRKPFTPPDPSITGESRKGPYIEYDAKLFKLDARNGQAWLIDPFGIPYAYFAPLRGKSGAYAGQTFTLPAAQFTINPMPSGSVSPFLEGGRYIKEDSFQIISAGNDGQFGPGGNLPAQSPAEAIDDQAHFQDTLLGGAR
jgi:prepilin-type N-terminal cleavage/methylation domain-containing protein